MRGTQFRIEQGESEKVTIPATDHLALWPRFDEYDFENINLGSARRWLIKLAQLQTAMQFQVSLWTIKLSEAGDVQERSTIRAHRGLREAYANHYKELGKAMSRNLSAMMEEIRSMGRHSA